MTKLEKLVDAVHASGHKGVWAITGGGTGAFDRLLRFGGGSATLVDGLVPYGNKALERVLGGAPEKSVSSEAARRLAVAAYQRAQDLEGDGPKRFGVAVTCSLAKKGAERPDRRHNACIAYHKEDGTEVIELDLPRADRPLQEDVVSRLAVLAVAMACEVEGAPRSHEELVALEVVLREEEGDLLSLSSKPCSVYGQARQVAAGAWSALHRAKPAACWRDGRLVSEPVKAILPGSFNPRHEGHLAMADAAGKLLSCEVVHELALRNVDKPALDFVEVARRVAAFGDGPLVLTNTPTFVEKSALFPGAVFVVGADTWTRFLDPKYYGGNPVARDEAIERVRANGCRFYVCGRVVDGVYRCIGTTPYGSFATEVPESLFPRMDVSSTEKRKAVAR